jgi:hypothetical protein
MDLFATVELFALQECRLLDVSNTLVSLIFGTQRKDMFRFTLGRTDTTSAKEAGLAAQQQQRMVTKRVHMAEGC